MIKIKDHHIYMVYEHTYWEYKHIVHSTVVQFIYNTLLNVT